MKNKFLVGGIIAGMLFSTTPVMAKGNATVEFTGENSVTVGETFKVYMNVLDVEDTYDGVVSFGGNIEFDETKIEYISSKSGDAPYLFQINEEADYIVAGLDFTLDNGIRDDLMVYEFTFKALEEGNVTITIENAKLTDSTDYIDTTIISKDINIVKETIDVEEVVLETEELNNENDVVVNDEVPSKIESEETEETQEIEITEVDPVVTEEEVKENNLTILEKISNYISGIVSKLFSIFR